MINIITINNDEFDKIKIYFVNSTNDRKIIIKPSFFHRPYSLQFAWFEFGNRFTKRKLLIALCSR